MLGLPCGKELLR